VLPQRQRKLISPQFYSSAGVVRVIKSNYYGLTLKLEKAHDK